MFINIIIVIIFNNTKIPRLSLHGDHIRLVAFEQCSFFCRRIIIIIIFLMTSRFAAEQQHADDPARGVRRR